MTRGEIYLVDLSGEVGAEQGGIRPAVIIQNDKGNQYSPTTMICPMTSRMKKNIPTHVLLTQSDGVSKTSICLCEQLRTIDKSRIIKKLGEVKSRAAIEEINKKVAIAAGLV